MPTLPPDRSRRSLSHGQRMFLLYGPADRWDDAFADEREVYEAWNQHRAQILSYYRGRRPWAWWALESAIPFPGHDRERAVLYEAGLLGEEERAELVAHWRARFVQAQQPGFTYCVGFAKPGDTTATWLEGAPARRAHYRWAGIPRSLLHALLKEWLRGRPRSVRSKTVRAPEEAAPPADPTIEALIG
jgi:hypothetical protein